MLSNGEYIVDFCYMFFIVLSIYFYYNESIKQSWIILGILAIIIGLLVIFLEKDKFNICTCILFNIFGL